MNNGLTPLGMASRALLDPAGISHNELQRVLESMLANKVDYADLYFQSARRESWVLEDEKVKEGSYSLQQGVGVRAVSGEKTGFAYSEDIVLPALESAAVAAKTVALQGGSNIVKIGEPTSMPRILYGVEDPLQSISEQDKRAILYQVNHEARRLDSRIKQVIVSLSGAHEMILLMASDGTFSADVRPLVRLNVNVIALEGARREQGSYGGGGRCDYRRFLEGNIALEYAREAVRQAIVNLEAVEAPAGSMPVVLGPGWPGVLLHEAIGHGLEGDFNRKGSSLFAGRIGERVASPLCTVVDDGTLAGRRGSLNMDDEGTPTQCTTLIENGILKGYLQDKLNARLMNASPTGNGRRESYAHVTIPRMTNTYMLAGHHAPEEIIASVERGLYAVNFGGGQVDITSGKFVFNASEAYLIEKGKITRPVKGATLIGSGAEVLQKIVLVGNDLQLDTGIGVCGKEGQSVPVGVGQPTLKIEAMTVGGTEI